MKKQTGRIRCALAFSMAAAVTSSCSSIAVHSGPPNEPGPYAGTRLAVKETKRSWMAPKFYGEALFVMYDIPLSIITDTILLPLDGRVARRLNGIRSSRARELIGCTGVGVSSNKSLEPTPLRALRAFKGVRRGSA